MNILKQIIPYSVINYAKQIMLYLFFFATNALIITNSCYASINNSCPDCFTASQFAGDAAGLKYRTHHCFTAKQ